MANTQTFHIADVTFFLTEENPGQLATLSIDGKTLDRESIKPVLMMIQFDLAKKYWFAAQFGDNSISFITKNIIFGSNYHKPMLTTEHIKTYLTELSNVAYTKDELVGMADFSIGNSMPKYKFQSDAAASSKKAFTPENIYKAVSGLLAEFGDEYGAVPVTYALAFRQDECNRTPGAKFNAREAYDVITSMDDSSPLPEQIKTAIRTRLEQLEKHCETGTHTANISSAPPRRTSFSPGNIYIRVRRFLADYSNVYTEVMVTKALQKRRRECETECKKFNHVQAYDAIASMSGPPLPKEILGGILKRLELFEQECERGGPSR